jgi:general stress protein 26
MKLSLINITKIWSHFNNNPLAVISTADELRKQSESALIAFTQNNDLELYFMTFVDSRKFANLQTNQSVSLVIGFGYTTVQYEGIAYALKNWTAEEALHAFFQKDTPCSPEFLNDPRARFFKVIPKWIRYSDYTVFPAEIFETFW